MENKMYKYGCIYRITFPNNKNYIGRSIKPLYNIKHRYFVTELKNSKRPVIQAIKKYGVENVIIDIIEEYNDITNLLLNEKEYNYIKEYNSMIFENGYNVAEGGGYYDNFTNNPNRDEIIENIKLRLKNNHPRKGVILTQETKDKISAKAIERLKDKTNHPSYNKKRSEKTLLLISMSLKGKYIGGNNKNWIGYLDKNKLDIAIKNGLTYVEMYKALNSCQKTIKRSILHYYGDIPLPSLSLILKHTKEEIYEDIMKLSGRKLCKYMTIRLYEPNKKG